MTEKSYRIFLDPRAAMRRDPSDYPSARPGCPAEEPDPYYDAQGLVVLNPSLDLHPAPDFFPIYRPAAPGESAISGSTSLDPRLVDVLRNDRLILDRPVLQPAQVQPLCLDPDAAYPSTGVQASYADLTGGQIQYYTDADISQTFFSPVYEMPAVVRPSMFRDPMGSLKVYYDREPLLRRNAALSDYSFDEDQMSFREDLMSRQSSLMDRSDYQKFHAHFG